MQLDKLNNGHARVAFLMSLGIGSNKTIDNDDDTVTHECFAYQSETLFLFCYFYCYVKGCVYGQPGFNSTLKGPNFKGSKVSSQRTKNEKFWGTWENVGMGKS